MLIRAFFSLFMLFCIPFCTALASELINYYDQNECIEVEKLEKHHLQLGIEKFNKGKFEYAWKELATVLHFIPNHPKALQMIADLSMQMEKPQRAIRYFERALQNFDDANTHALYGKLLYDAKEYEPAIEQLLLAVELAPDEANYYHWLSLAYKKNHDLAQALTFAELALQKYTP